MSKFKGSLAVLVGAASFGVLSTIVKKAYESGFTLGEVTGSQAFVGALLLWIAYFLSRRSVTYTGHTSAHPTWLVYLAGFSTGAVSILYYRCVELVPASIAIILLMQYIWIGTVLEWLIFRARPRRVQVIGSLLIIAGTLFSTGILEKGIAQLSVSGILFGLLAATAYALFIILNGRVGNDYPVLKKSALMVSGALTLIVTILFPKTLLSLHIMEQILPYTLLLALLGTVIPPLLFAYGMPKTGYPLGSILSAVELPVAVLMSYLILKEDVSTLQWLGIVFILIVIAYINTLKKRHTL